MEKSADAFRTISEVAEILETPAHVLRFWESRFPQIRPVKRAGGRRYYRPADVALLSGIRKLLHDDGMTIRGVQKILREQGVRHVAALGGADPGPEAAEEGTAGADLPEIFLLEPEAPPGEVVPFEPRSSRGIEAEARVTPGSSEPGSEETADPRLPDEVAPDPRDVAPAPEAAPFTPPPPLPTPAWADLAAELAGGFAPVSPAPAKVSDRPPAPVPVPSAAAAEEPASAGAPAASTWDLPPPEDRPAAAQGFASFGSLPRSASEEPDNDPDSREAPDVGPAAFADLDAWDEAAPLASGSAVEDAATAGADLAWPPGPEPEEGAVEPCAPESAPDTYAREPSAPEADMPEPATAGTLPDEADAAPGDDAPARDDDSPRGDEPVVWTPSLLRALPPGALADRRAEVEALRQRLLALRARLTDAARG